VVPIRILVRFLNNIGALIELARLLARPDHVAASPKCESQQLCDPLKIGATSLIFPVIELVRDYLRPTGVGARGAARGRVFFCAFSFSEAMNASRCCWLYS